MYVKGKPHWHYTNRARFLLEIKDPNYLFV